MQKTIGIVVLAFIIGGGVGYVGAGALNHTATNTANGFAGRGAGFAGLRNRTGATGTGGFLAGTVASKTATTLTINTRDGSSHIVVLTPTTSVSKSVSGSVSDITVGADVMVSGTSNSDGSVSANVVQLRPSLPKTPTQ